MYSKKNTPDAVLFRRAENVGAFLGLTPRRYQSEEIGWSGRISKCDDGAMRGLLGRVAKAVEIPWRLAPSM